MARRFRISIASLMIVVVLLAIGLAGLRYPSHLWVSALFSITIGLIPTAILGIACCREQRRAAWAGPGLSALRPNTVPRPLGER